MNSPRNWGRIGVLMGGYSSEREISLKSGTAVFNALKENGADVVALDIVEKNENGIVDQIRQAGLDVALIVLHGRLGEDGTIQAILEKENIPYAGSGVAASRIAINKVKTQSLLKELNIPVADFIVLSDEKEIDIEKIVSQLSLPVVVKPACEGSSIGISVVAEKKNLEVALREAFRYGKEVLIERYLEGKEITVGILGQQALPTIEILAPNGFFDFKSKYQSGMTEYLIPARISAEAEKAAQATALRAHQALGCRDISRVDMIVNDEHLPHVLEINTIPGFTSTSLLPKAAKAAGVDFTQLCFKLIELAYEKKK